MNTNRTSGKHGALTAGARRRVSRRHIRHQLSEGVRQADAGDLPAPGTQTENAAKVWSAIAKHRDACHAQQAARDANGETDPREDGCADAVKDVFPR